MKRSGVELAAGVFILAGLVCLGWLSIRLGKLSVIGGSGYEVTAVFSNTGGLKTGAEVAIAGVEVGRVKTISLADYRAQVVLFLDRGVRIQDDSIASIKTRGLVGEKYVSIEPGGSDRMIAPGGRIRETQPAVDLESVLSKYVFGKI